jgi:hypothetical protein
MDWEELRESLKNPFIRPETSWLFADLPESIEVGILGKAGIDMLTETAKDPQHRERGTYVKVDFSEKLQLQKPTFANIGTKYQVQINQALEVYSFIDFSSVSEKIAAIIHTHPLTEYNDEFIHIPSPLDISNLFLTSRNPTSISLIYTQASTHNSQGLHWMLIRTKDTEITDTDTAQEWVYSQDRKLAELYALSKNSGQDFVKQSQEHMIQLIKELKIGVYISQGDGGVFKRV